MVVVVVVVVVLLLLLLLLLLVVVVMVELPHAPCMGSDSVRFDKVGGGIGVGGYGTNRK